MYGNIKVGRELAAKIYARPPQDGSAVGGKER